MTAYRLIPDKCDSDKLKFHIQILDGEFQFIQFVAEDFNFSHLDDGEKFYTCDATVLSDRKDMSDDEKSRLDAVIDEIIGNIVDEAFRMFGGK